MLPDPLEGQRKFSPLQGSENCSGSGTAPQAQKPTYGPEYLGFYLGFFVWGGRRS